MKKFAATPLMSALFTGLALWPIPAVTAHPKARAASNNSAEELKQIENDWVAASKAKNANKLGEILADGWVGLEWDGKTIDKAKALADLKASGNRTDSIEVGPMNVRFFGNTAVVTGSDTETSVDRGKDASGKYIWTDVFVKQNGKWRAVSSQSTKVPK